MRKSRFTEEQIIAALKTSLWLRHGPQPLLGARRGGLSPWGGPRVPERGEGLLGRSGTPRRDRAEASVTAERRAKLLQCYSRTA
jgi:hypothetical protein